MASNNQAYYAARVPRVCSVPGCDRKHYGLGYCFAHYRRLNAGKPINDKPLRNRSATGICSLRDCERPHYANGLCSLHNDRRKRDAPLDAPILRSAARRKVSLERLQHIAAGRGGRCLSPSYDGKNDVPLWECQHGHQWSTSFASIVGGSWCPICPSGRGERICRSVLELMFGKPFPKERPEWLRLSNRRKLELDGYNESLALAFEYHGVQHYEAVTTFKDGRFSQERVDDIKRRDAEKRRMCWARGVKLIVVPEVGNIADVNAIVNQIELSVLQADVKIPRGWAAKRPQDISSLWAASEKSHPLPDRIISYVTKRGVECLSSHYTNSYTTMTWRCSNNHHMEASWSAMSRRRGKLCPVCVEEDIASRIGLITDDWGNSQILIRDILDKSGLFVAQIAHKLGPRRLATGVKSSRRSDSGTSHWITDGTEAKRHLKIDPIPSGWQRGRDKGARVWINSGKETKRHLKADPVPDGWTEGRIPWSIHHGETCSVNECLNPILAKGLCSGHYKRQHKGQPIGDAHLQHRWSGPCSTPGCERKIKANALCDLHYKKAWRRRSNLPVPVP